MANSERGKLVEYAAPSFNSSCGVGGGSASSSHNNNNRGSKRQPPDRCKPARPLRAGAVAAIAASTLALLISGAESQSGYLLRAQPPVHQQSYPPPPGGYRLVPPALGPPPPLAPAQQPARYGQVAQVSYAPFERRYDEQQPLDSLVLPSDYDGNVTQDMIKSAYLIDDKRFVDVHQTRCFASTKVDDLHALEPDLIIIGLRRETRVPASASLERIRQAGFDPAKRTQIFVHGFTQSYPDTEWLRKVRALYEVNQQLVANNLIFLDWGKAASQTFSRAAADTVLIGSHLAEFVLKLLELGANRYDLHLIGHSLGAHVCGFAGKRIRPRVGRITALDAAGPCFGKVTSNGPHDRLGPDDAFQVDAFHYDDEFLGLPGQHGQHDVYVNSGSVQPGCKGNINTLVNAAITLATGRDRVLSESHTRSTEVAVEQLAVRECQMVAYECRDYGAFSAGECGKCDEQNNQCFMVNFEYQYAASSKLGQPLAAASPQRRLRSSFPGKRFYVTTGQYSNDFCLEHYQIVVKFEPTQEFKASVKAKKWQFNLLLITNTGDRLNGTVTNQMGVSSFSYLLLAMFNGKRIVGAEIEAQDSGKQAAEILPAAQFKSRPFETNTNSPFKLLQVDINYMSSVDPKVRRAVSSSLCALASEPSSLNYATAIGRGPANELGRFGRQSMGYATPLELRECRGPPGSLV